MTEDKIEALRKIKALLDEGALSQNEFDALKVEILNPSVDKSAAESTGSKHKSDKAKVIAKNKTKDAQIEKKADESPAQKLVQNVKPEARAVSDKKPTKKATIGSELKSEQKTTPRNKDKSDSGKGKRTANSPKRKQGGDVKFVLTPTTPSDNIESIELEIKTTKKKTNKPSKIMLIGLMSFVVVSAIVFGALNGWFSNNEVASREDLPSKYVFCGKLALYSSPYQTEYTKRVVSGDSVGFIKDSSINNIQWTKLNYRGDILWAKTYKYGIQYLVGKSEIKNYESMFSGAYVQQVYEKMPAYAKIGLINFCKDNAHKDYKVLCASQDLLSVAYFRSRIGNRSKSTDKAQGINMGMKDMGVLFTTSNYEKELVVFSFNENGQSHVVFKRTISRQIVGLKRVKRRTKQRFLSRYSFEEERLILDALILVVAPRYWTTQNDKILYRRELNGGLNLYRMR